MLKYIIIVTFVITSISRSYAQVNNFSKGFGKGFQDGYCYEMGLSCLPPLIPLTPLPKLNESLTNFQDGYQRGFQTGLDLQRLKDQETPVTSASTNRYDKVPNYTPSAYVPPLNIELLGSVVLKKQKMFDSRVEWIQKRIFNIEDLATILLYPYAPDIYSDFNSAKEEYVQNQLSRTPLDFSDLKVFSDVVNKLNILEKYVYSNYREVTSELGTIRIPSNYNDDVTFTLSRTSQKYYILMDRGVQKSNLEELGNKVLYTSSGSIGTFRVFRDNQKNKKYYVPNSVFINPILNMTYSIYAK